MYRGHKTVILDDIRADFCALHTLLRLFDGYPLTVERKGGHSVVKAERFIVTTSAPPTMFYPSKTRDDGDIRQLLRRVTTVLQFSRSHDLNGDVIYEQIDMTEEFQCGKFFV